ncbi:MAG TPA: serine hydrolase domain-containing protein, partial [Ignavibacteriaceae bacterium]
MNKYSHKFSFLILLVCLINSISFSQENRNKILDEYLIDYLKNKNIPSISAGILDKGEIVWLKSEGKSDIENNVSVTNSSLYRIASISKPITAVA